MGHILETITQLFDQEAEDIAQRISANVKASRDLDKFDLLRLMILCCTMQDPDRLTLAYICAGSPKNLAINNPNNDEWLTQPKHRNVISMRELLFYSFSLCKQSEIKNLPPEDLAIDNPNYIKLQNDLEQFLKPQIQNEFKNRRKILKVRYKTKLEKALMKLVA